MSDQGEPHAPEWGAVVSVHDQLLGWFREHALPLWDAHGVDRERGGYFETLAADGAGNIAAAGDIRRGRVVARQIFVFDLARRLGWRSTASDPAEHGCDYLFAHLYGPDGAFHTAVDRARRPCAPFSLYEHAFYLFALARVAATSRHPAADTALACLRRLRTHWSNPNGGFEESNPPSVPLKSNPHMHLLEAALAWREVSDERPRSVWTGLAEEIVRLCLTRFVDADTGAVREYFDPQWLPAPGDAGRIVEPGHQFEWAWLLMEWASTDAVAEAGRVVCLRAASRLVDVGERYGVDEARNVAVNELWDDMRMKDAAAKLWPQTERLKAWCAMFVHASPVDRPQACRKIAAAAHGVLTYLLHEPRGLWREVRAADGTFVVEPSRASSLYHIVGAIDVLRRTVQGRGMSVTGVA